jgi:hypothetical protein
MRLLNLSNEKKRDAQVGFESIKEKSTIEMVLPDGTPKLSARALRATLATGLDALMDSYGSAAAVAQAIIESDPDVDPERFGMILPKTRRVYLSKNGTVAYCVNVEEVVCNPDGSVKEVRPYQPAEANISGDIPLRWTGKMLPKSQAVRMFAFTHTYQIKHINGLTFDFLFAMAKQLHEANAMMLLGAGPKGNAPLVMSQGGSSYRAFLEGRVDGERYCLAMHLSNLELKVPSARQGGEA